MPSKLPRNIDKNKIENDKNKNKNKNNKNYKAKK